MFVRSQLQYEQATALLAIGLDPSEVASALAVPLSTMKGWARRPLRRRAWNIGDFEGWRPSNGPAYAYLLGAYLGDGCIARHRRGASSNLALALDAQYSEVVDEIAAAIGAVVPGVAIARTRRRSRCVVLQASHPVWPVAFPQHGPGKKHHREIQLEPWQLEITHAHPRELIRGLIHSDGCRSVNRFKTKLQGGRVAEYAYTRYFFSNLSEGIKDIFCSHCDLLGVRWSRANTRYVSVHDRESVRILDSFVGPKR